MAHRTCRPRSPTEHGSAHSGSRHASVAEPSRSTICSLDSARAPLSNAAYHPSPSCSSARSWQFEHGTPIRPSPRRHQFWATACPSRLVPEVQSLGPQQSSSPSRQRVLFAPVIPFECLTVTLRTLCLHTYQHSEVPTLCPGMPQPLGPIRGALEGSIELDPRSHRLL